MFRKVYSLHQDLLHNWVAEKAPAWVLCTKGDECLLSDISPNIDSLDIVCNNGLFPLYVHSSDLLFDTYEEAIIEANKKNKIREEVLVCV
jgi:hypothetical protein